MKNTTKFNELLKQLMLGLIYPAVLGSILYFTLDAVLGPIASLFTGQVSGQPIGALKFWLLGITLTFYCCDYVYIMFTKEPRFLFFLLDLAFLATLYLTFLAIDVRAGASTEPHIQLILWCYCVFIGLYLVWDVIGKLTCEPRSAERHYYTWVIVWEVTSLVAFGYCLYSTPPNTIVVSILAGSTAWFGYVAWQKRLYFPTAA